MATTRERLERITAEAPTPRSLRERALAELRAAVPFDGAVWLLTDPVTSVGTSPLVDLPMLPGSRLPELMRWRYLTVPNRWTELGSQVAAGMAAGMDDDRERATPWDELLSGVGVTDVASVVFRDRFGCWAWLDLWRQGARFTAAEIVLLRDLAAPLTTGIRAAQARTFVDTTDRVGLSGPVVVLLDQDLQVTSSTSAAAAALDRRGRPGDPIAAAAMNVASALVAAEHGVPVGPAWSRRHLGGGAWVTLRAERLSGGAGIAVTIEESTPAERREVFALAFGLSPREREVLAHLVTGADSRAIAGSLFLSEHTVNDHVRALLARCGAPTRQVLAARIAGYYLQ